MPKADIFTQDGVSYLSVQTTYQDRHLMTELPGARYRRQDGVWAAPLSWATCVTLRGLFGAQLELGEDLQRWAWETRTKRVEPAMALRNQLELPSVHADFPALDAVEEGATLKLYPYQRVDVRFLLANERAILANPPGLGKTGVVIRFIQVLQHLGLQPFPALIICPNSLKFAAWQRELETWAPELTVNVIDGGAATRRKQLARQADVTVINWDSLRLHSKLAPYGNVELTDAEKTAKELNDLGFRFVAMDEAHRLKDPRSKQTRAAWAVSHGARYRVAMTGTPVADHVGDLWSLGHAVEPTWLPAKSRFMDRYAQVSLNFFGGAEVVGVNPHHLDELYRIIDPLMRRVPKEAALPFLPPKLPVQYRYTPMSTKQRTAYNQMRDDMVANLNELLVAPNPLSRLTRLMQLAASYAEIEWVTRQVRTRVRTSVNGEPSLDPNLTIDDLFDEEGEYVSPLNDENAAYETVITEMQVPVVRLTNPSAKVDDLVDLLGEMGDDPLVVAAVSRQLIELASKRLTDLKISHGLVTGAQSADERRVNIDAFQAGKTRVILLTLGAGAEGITLTRADTMLFMQESFSEIQNQQAQDRIYRIGSERHASIRIIKQVTPDSVEEHKLEVLAEKRGRMEEIVRDEAVLRKLLGI